MEGHDLFRVSWREVARALDVTVTTMIQQAEKKFSAVEGAYVHSGQVVAMLIIIVTSSHLTK